MQKPDRRNRTRFHRISAPLAILLFLGGLLFAAGPARAAETSASRDVIIETNVPVVMRDGVVLRADVHRPTAPGSYPVLVMRTPYGKYKQHFEKYVKAGYIVVCEDVRGRYASDGQWECWLRPKTHDAEDGYETVQWAAKLPGANGKVGTFGLSYSAFLQWRLAPLRPPALVAMSAHSIPAHYTDLEEPGTIRPGRRLRWSVVTMSPEMRRRAGRPAPRTEAEAAALWDSSQSRKWLDFLPWLDLPREVFEDETPYLIDWLRHPQNDPWQLDHGCAEISVPNLEVVGWYDHAKGDMVMERTLMQKGRTATARKGSRLVIGPWSHFPPGGRRFGPIDFGPAADLDLVGLDIRWFDHWLKGAANGVERNAPVRIFVMGDNAWRDENEWPPKRARSKVFFFDGAGHANTPGGDGALVPQCPVRKAADHYTYDPLHPVPTLFGPGNFTCATDQRPLSNRVDILVYQTGPLANRIEVTGFPQVELYAESSAPDTDWVARLIDVAPDGLARDVCEGVLRARYREGTDHPKFLSPDRPERFLIRMAPTSNAFLPGHRIRLDVTSSDFPNYDRNHNTAADPNSDATLVTANQTVYHGPVLSSKLILPWIR